MKEITLDNYCKKIKSGNEKALVEFLNTPEIQGIVQGQVRYFLSRTGNYTEGELSALIQNTIWSLVKDKFILPPEEYDSGKTILSFLTNNLGQYVKDVIDKLDTSKPVPDKYAYDVEELVPSVFEDIELKEEIKADKQFITYLFNLAQSRGTLDEKDITVLMLRHTDKTTYEKIASKCTELYGPEKPYTSGWASGRYRKAIDALKRLAVKVAKNARTGS